MPKNIDLDNQFGTYNIKLSVTDNMIIAHVATREKKPLPPSDYPVLVKFYDDMYKADRSKIVL
jgi:hypothetical protein